MDEVWRAVPIEPFNMLEVSSAGRVRRVNYRRNFPEGRILIPHLNKKTGYLMIGIYVARRHVWNTVHRLVCAAFHGAPEPGMTVNHKNFDRTDNRPENLEWVTLADNTKHQWANDRAPRGLSTWNCKADPAIVHQMLKDGRTLAAIARHFGVTPSTVHGMRRRYRARGEWHV